MDKLRRHTMDWLSYICALYLLSYLAVLNTSRPAPSKLSLLREGKILSKLKQGFCDVAPIWDTVHWNSLPQTIKKAKNWRFYQSFVIKAIYLIFGWFERKIIMKFGKLNTVDKVQIYYVIKHNSWWRNLSGGGVWRWHLDFSKYFFKSSEIFVLKKN